MSRIPQPARSRAGAGHGFDCDDGPRGAVRSGRLFTGKRRSGGSSRSSGWRRTSRRGSRHSRTRERQPFHLTMLARDLTGYRNLLQLVTKSNLEGFYYKPRIDRELLEQHSAGITVLSGCPSSEFFERLSEGDRDGAVEVAKWYREVFDGHYALEVQEHGVERFSRVNPEIVSVGRELDIPVVATNDGHFTHAEEAAAHDVLLCIGTNANGGRGGPLPHRRGGVLPPQRRGDARALPGDARGGHEYGGDRGGLRPGAVLRPRPPAGAGHARRRHERRVPAAALPRGAGGARGDADAGAATAPRLRARRAAGHGFHGLLLRGEGDLGLRPPGAHPDGDAGGRRRPRWRSTRWGSRTSTRWPTTSCSSAS